MRAYFSIIKYSQLILLGFSIGILLVLPSLVATAPELVDFNLLYAAAHFSLFLVMTVRPLADLLPKVKIIRPLVILRKGMGVFSASIIVSFILAKLITDPGGYLSSMGTSAYWSMEGLALLAHLADISAVLLLITSNNLSKRLLGPNWKRLQRLSYVYFYGSGLYVFFIVGGNIILFYLIVVTILTTFAFIKNRAVRITKANLATP